jgi:hypothetical protein
VLKENQPEVKEAVRVWVEGEGREAADLVTVDKRHGRIEERSLWWVEAGELGRYLEEELDWPGVTVCGRIRRVRWVGEGKGREEEEHLWVCSAPVEWATPERVQRWLRGHWGIENRVFWVRDVSYGEDRWSGRKIGPALAALRDGALNLIRGLGYRYVPDAWRAFSVPSGRLLHCLLAPL